MAYWRLNDADGTTARSCVAGGQPARLHGGFAWFLPGVGSGTGIGAGQQLTASAFSGPRQINRAVHLADGWIEAPFGLPEPNYTVALWCWLGEPSGASPRQGTLLVGPSGERLTAHQDASHRLRLELDGQMTAEDWPADQWHFVVLARDERRLQVLVDGAPQPCLQVDLSQSLPPGLMTGHLMLGQQLQGKLDEVAVFDRCLTAEQIGQLWQVSGIELQRLQREEQRQRDEAAAIERIQPPRFPDDYAETIASLQPLVYEPLTDPPKSLVASGGLRFSPGLFASADSGRLAWTADRAVGDYSAAGWFRNELSHATRPVTAYLFSRGPDADRLAPGDHLGIGGTHQANLTGKLIFFNGNHRNQVAIGKTLLPPGSWHQFVLLRQGGRVRVFLDGHNEPEIDAEVDNTAEDSSSFFWAARSDYFAPLSGHLAHVALFDRELTTAEVQQLAWPSGLSAPVVAETGPAPKTPAPESLPVAAEDALQRIHVPPGYRVDLVASEPLLVDPVAFDWDVQGRRGSRKCRTIRWAWMAVGSRAGGYES